jgi:hypothetical protein
MLNVSDYHRSDSPISEQSTRLGREELALCKRAMLGRENELENTDPVSVCRCKRARTQGLQQPSLCLA